MEGAVAVVAGRRVPSAKQIILGLAQSIKERDILTYEHSRRVATYAQRLALHYGWNRLAAQELALAALVHDLGKTWITNDILLKTAPLSHEERLIMEKHPVIGARMLLGYDLHPFYVETVLYHHEAFDGHGYPAGLRGEEIPLSARMLAIVDAYDALTSQRPYKPALSSLEAWEQLMLSAGTHFDPVLLDAFIDLLKARCNFVLSHRLYTRSSRLIYWSWHDTRLRRQARAV
jgi:putative nucleotidyltransferase with HDIG domain